MKKGQIMEGVVERVDFPNKGIVRMEECSVTVKNTIPGQRIRFVISKKRSGRAEGRLLEVLQPSPLETEKPACTIFPACGGCSWQTMQYEDQLLMKANQVKRLLNPVLCAAGQEGWCEKIPLLNERDLGAVRKKDGIFEGIYRSQQEFRYRNKMEFSFGDEYKDGPLCLGLHKRGSRYDVLTAADCKLVHSDMTAILTATLTFFQEQGISYYHKMTHQGVLRHLLLRRAEKTGEILVCLVTAGEHAMEAKDRASDVDNTAIPRYSERNAEHSAQTFSELLQAYTARILSLPLEGTVVGILHMLNNSVADIVQSDQTTTLYGKDFFYESLLGLRFKITPFSFFQTNSLGAETLYSIAREYTDDTKDATVFDLYSGTGTISQILSPVAAKVVGVEIVEEAVEAARLNARMNGLDNCTFLAGDVLQILDSITEPPDFIVLDPPRDGIHPKALQKIIAYGAPRILYISCKPTSLARDLEVLFANGYRAERIFCVDMFPQTANVETVVQLSKGEINSKKVRVEFSLEDMDMSGFQKGSRGPGDLGFEPTGAERRPTYGQIKDYVKEHSGLSVSSLYIAQVKQKYGIIERECYNKPKSENARQPQCPPEKEAAITEALRWFKMIE